MENELMQQNVKMIEVEVVYALPDQQSLLSVMVEDNSTALEAVQQSGIINEYPEIDLETIKMGIFSKSCATDYKLKAGDRVEIYRPLLADPKEIRKRRAAEMAEKKKLEEALKS